MGSVDNALQLIQLLRDSGWLRLVDAADELGISPSTAHRLLAMLVYRGFAVRGPDREYLPGPAMRGAPIEGTAVLAMKRMVQPHLERLMAATGETSELIIRVGSHVRFLCTVQGTNTLSVEERRGWIQSAAQTSGGKALLAEIPPDELPDLYGEDEQSGDASTRLVGIASLRDREFQQVTEELRQIRRRGFATNSRGNAFGIAVTIHAADKSVGAITVSLPLARATEPVCRGILSQIAETKHRIERDFEDSGFRGSDVPLATPLS